MATSIEERNRILRLLEMGQLNALEAAQLLDALGSDQARIGERARSRILRVQFTRSGTALQKVNMTATMPLSIVKAGLRLGTRLLPQLSNSALVQLVQTVEAGASGRLLDLQDLEEGERFEIFAE